MSRRTLVISVVVGLGLGVLLGKFLFESSDEVGPPEAAARQALTDAVTARNTGTQDLRVVSPQTYQVFQRDQRASGRFFVTGRVGVEADGVEVRVTGTPAQGTLGGVWRRIAFVPTTAAFGEHIRIPAGGWYRLEIRARKGTETVAEAAIEQFGIGEVFVTAGQSNSTNCGEFTTKQTAGMTASFGGQTWKLAADPLDGSHGMSTGGSPWLAFGDAMHAKYGVPIGIAITGHGGTSADWWQPERSLFPWLMKRIDQLGPMGFRALLWHQGEADFETPADEYYRKLKHIIDASRTAARWEFPWFVAQVSYRSTENPRFDNTRDTHKRLWDEGIALEGPDTDTLLEDNRDTNSTGIHFSPKGLKAHGKMWAGLVSRYLDPVLGN